MWLTIQTHTCVEYKKEAIPAKFCVWQGETSQCMQILAVSPAPGSKYHCGIGVEGFFSQYQYFSDLNQNIPVFKYTPLSSIELLVRISSMTDISGHIRLPPPPAVEAHLHPSYPLFKYFINTFPFGWGHFWNGIFLVT